MLGLVIHYSSAIMGLEEMGITEEELERICESMKGHFKPETIRDFKELCRMDLYLNTE